MEKRVVLAVILSLIILIVYHQYFAPAPPEAPKGKPVPEKTLPSGQGKEAVGQPVSSSPKTAKTGAGLPPAEAAPVLRAEPGKEVTIDTPLYTAVFNTRGARLTGWRVKKYLDKIGKGAKPINLATEALGSGSPFELEITEANFPFPSEPLYQASTESLKLDRKHSQGEVVFTWKSPEGLKIAQKMIFHAADYGIGLEVQIINLSSHSYQGRPLLTWVDKKLAADKHSGGFGCVPTSGGTRGVPVAPFTALVNREYQEVELKDLKNEKRFTENVDWGGVQSQYFLAAFVPQKSEGSELIFTKIGENEAKMAMGGPKALLPPNTQVTQSYSLYVGPKDLDLLKPFGHNLDRALDFGWFDIVAKPMLHAMKFFYAYTGNYGLAIIILTVIIKILFWYPTQISFRSMREMKKLQPEMAKLREKFKNDRERINKEMMDLYRRYKINPMSGCLPMVIQIPVFFALYKVLLYSIELRHAPFYWWIQDLSAADPYYISPILMGASMLAQQWLTPTTGDPTQAKMMLIMPVVFTFMFLSFPTGLVLYWLFSNLLSIGQQLYINRQSK
jgi:YidC/Oxa1 family membrane protein insertase